MPNIYLLPLSETNGIRRVSTLLDDDIFSSGAVRRTESDLIVAIRRELPGLTPLSSAQIAALASERGFSQAEFEAMASQVPVPGVVDPGDPPGDPPGTPQLEYARTSGATTINLGNGRAEGADRYYAHVSTTPGFTPTESTLEAEIGSVLVTSEDPQIERPYPHTCIGLEPDTTYYVKVVAENDYGTSVSPEMSATTLPAPAHNPGPSTYPNEPSGFQQVTYSDWTALPPDTGAPAGWDHFAGSGDSGEQGIDSGAGSGFPGNLLRQTFFPFIAGHGGGRTHTGSLLFGTTEAYISNWYKFDRELIGNPIHIKVDFWQYPAGQGGHQAHSSYVSRNNVNLPSSPSGWFNRWGIRFRTGCSSASLGSGFNQQDANAPIEVPRREWFQIEQYFRSHDEGQQNGIWRIWQDGVLIHEWTDIVFPSGAFERWRIDGVHGGTGFGPVENSSYFCAETYISTPA